MAGSLNSLISSLAFNVRGGLFGQKLLFLFLHLLKLLVIVDSNSSTAKDVASQIQHGDRSLEETRNSIS